MTDEKKIAQLSSDDLKEIRGGIPYEAPDIFDISRTNATCGVGTICSKGDGDSCSDGKVCSNGKTGPSTDASSEGGL